MRCLSHFFFFWNAILQVQTRSSFDNSLYFEKTDDYEDAYSVPYQPPPHTEDEIYTHLSGKTYRNLPRSCVKIGDTIGSGYVYVLN